jgi:hypothetical protein
VEKDDRREIAPSRRFERVHGAHRSLDIPGAVSAQPEPL